MLFSSIAIVKPRIVNPKAISFRYNVIVSVGLFMGVMLFEIINPAKMLPKSNRFSFMLMSG
jgi:hypothetical protein